MGRFLFIAIIGLFVTGCPVATTDPSLPVENSKANPQTRVGNAEAYSGVVRFKPFYEMIPNYKCRKPSGELIASYRSRLTLDTKDGSVSYGRDACSPSETKISRDDVKISVTGLVSDYQQGLYQYIKDDPFDPNNTMYTIWCETKQGLPVYEFLLGALPTGSYQTLLFEVVSGAASSPQVFASSYVKNPGNRLINSIDPNVSFSATIGFSTLTISESGYSGDGTMRYPGSTTRQLTCHFSY